MEMSWLNACASLVYTCKVLLLSQSYISWISLTPRLFQRWSVALFELPVIWDFFLVSTSLFLILFRFRENSKASSCSNREWQHLQTVILGKRKWRILLWQDLVWPWKREPTGLPLQRWQGLWRRWLVSDVSSVTKYLPSRPGSTSSIRSLLPPLLIPSSDCPIGQRVGAIQERELGERGLVQLLWKTPILLHPLCWVRNPFSLVILAAWQEQGIMLEDIIELCKSVFQSKTIYWIHSVCQAWPLVLETHNSQTINK